MYRETARHFERKWRLGEIGILRHGVRRLHSSSNAGQPLHPTVNYRRQNEGNRVLKGRYDSNFWVSFESVTASEFVGNLKVLFSG